MLNIIRPGEEEVSADQQLEVGVEAEMYDLYWQAELGVEAERYCTAGDLYWYCTSTVLQVRPVLALAEQGSRQLQTPRLGRECLRGREWRGRRVHPQRSGGLDSDQDQHGGDSQSCVP